MRVCVRTQIYTTKKHKKRLANSTDKQKVNAIKEKGCSVSKCTTARLLLAAAAAVAAAGTATKTAPFGAAGAKTPASQSRRLLLRFAGVRRPTHRPF